MAILQTTLLDIRLDDDGDLFIGPRGFEMTSGPSGIAQLCKIALQLILGEWFLNQSRGIDWFNLLSTKGTQEQIKSAMRDTLLAVVGVSSVLSVSFSLSSSREGTASAVVSTAFGDVEVTASVGGTSG